MIKAIIFDYGNVISLPQTEAPFNEMEKLTNIPARIFAGVYDKFRNGFDRGEYDGAAMYSMLLESEGYSELARDSELMKKIAHIDMVTWQWVDDAVIDWVKELKARGFKLGILSNMPTEFLVRYEQHVEPFMIADYACFSCRVKLIKPEKAIYENVLNGLGVSAHEAVFFDDLRENIDAANEEGMHGFLWTNLEKAKIDLQNLLVCENLYSGLTAQVFTKVDASNTASSVGSGLLPVFATPAMIALMENAAAKVAASVLNSGFSTVGTEVCVKHLSATPPGQEVRASAGLIAVDGKKLVFSVEAFDDAGKIGEGTHTRFIVENKKFLARAAEKNS